MNRKLPPYIKIPGFIFFAIAALSFYFLLNRPGSSSLREAEEHYAAGEKAETIAARQEQFNLALSLYKDLENAYHPEFGSGKLYFNIANTYFQLGQYPQAILYYYKAYALMPREPKIGRNLQVAQSKLNLADPVRPNIYNQLFFFQYEFSLPERLQVFFFLAALAFALLSFLLWKPHVWTRWAFYTAAALAALVLFSAAYTRYFSPLEGIIVSSTELYRDAGINYAKVIPKPIPSGSKVEVLNITPNGKWIKIITPEGQFGYIPQTSISLI